MHAFRPPAPPRPDSPNTSDGRRPALRRLPPLCRYRVATAPGAGAYPVGRAVNVPRPWVRLRNRVA